MLITGLQLEVEKFFIFMLTVFLTALASASTAFLVSAGAKVTGVANLIMALLFVIQMVSCAWCLFYMRANSLLQTQHGGLCVFLCVCVCVCVCTYYSNKLPFSCLQLFGGFLIALDSLPGWIHWMKYLSLFRYAIEVKSTAGSFV